MASCNDPNPGLNCEAQIEPINNLNPRGNTLFSKEEGKGQETLAVECRFKPQVFHGNLSSKLFVVTLSTGDSRVGLVTSFEPSPSESNNITQLQEIMEDLDFPICILKMNLQCCEDFPARIKKLLRKVKGVHAITIDPINGLILVSGTTEPSVLIKSVGKIGQIPQLYAYEKDPTKAKTQFRTLLKRYATKERRDEPSPAPATATATTNVETCPPGGETFRGFGYSGPPTMMQMPIFTLPPRMGPPGWLAPGTKPRLMVKYEEPKVMTRKPPAPYPFDYYDGLGFPASNSLFHIFSDDNAQPCTIM